MKRDQDGSPSIESPQNVVDDKKVEVVEEQVVPTTSIVHGDLPKEWHFKKDHPKGLIIGKPSKGVSTRHSLKHLNILAFISQIKLRNIDEALNDESWVLAMQEKLNQFERKKVWTLVSRPKNYPIIGTKWVFRNKLDEQGTITRNKARLVAKGYNQE